MKAVLFLNLLVASAAQYVSYPWPNPTASSLNVTLGYGTVNSTGTRFNWYIAMLDDFNRFSIELPSQGCNVLQGTTATATASGCVVATNAGYFQFSMNPTYCLGSIVIRGQIDEWTDGVDLFALTSSNTTLVGTLTKAEIASLGVTYAVAAFGTIVSEGRPNEAGIVKAKAAIRKQKPTAEEIAPRTVLALDSLNRLMIVAIDGVEALYMGVTMTELAEIFSVGATGFPYKAITALNMDGGGSTTMSIAPSVMDSKASGPIAIFNRPTSSDLGPIVERGVTTIACVK
jgi:exopolysaccharide biosynthesis protein